MREGIAKEMACANEWAQLNEGIGLFKSRCPTTCRFIGDIHGAYYKPGWLSNKADATRVDV